MRRPSTCTCRGRRSSASPRSCSRTGNGTRVPDPGRPRSSRPGGRRARGVRRGAAARRLPHRTGAERGPPEPPRGARARTLQRVPGGERDPREPSGGRRRPGGAAMIRLAAVADLHVADDSAAGWREALAPGSSEADALLRGGDLTQTGGREEAKALGFALELVRIPVLAVLGNHDHHAERVPELSAILTASGVRLLEGTGLVLRVGG